MGKVASCHLKMQVGDRRWRRASVMVVVLLMRLKGVANGRVAGEFAICAGKSFAVGDATRIWAPEF